MGTIRGWAIVEWVGRTPLVDHWYVARTLSSAMEMAEDCLAQHAIIADISPAVERLDGPFYIVISDPDSQPAVVLTEDGTFLRGPLALAYLHEQQAA